VINKTERERLRHEFAQTLNLSGLTVLDALEEAHGIIGRLEVMALLWYSAAEQEALEAVEKFDGTGQEVELQHRLELAWAKKNRASIILEMLKGDNDDASDDVQDLGPGGATRDEVLPRGVGRERQVAGGPD